jgi:hypothetical protein
MDFQHLSGLTRRFEIFAAVVPKTKVQTLADRGLLDHVGVAFELIADCGSNEIGPVRVKALLHHEIDLPEVNVTEIDRDLLAVTGLWAELLYDRGHAVAIPIPSSWMVYGWRSDGFQEGTSAVKPDCAGIRGVVRGIVKGISGMGPEADAARSNDDVCCSNIGPLHV